MLSDFQQFIPLSITNWMTSPGATDAELGITLSIPAFATDATPTLAAKTKNSPAMARRFDIATV